MNSQDLIDDLKEALELLMLAGPNPLVTNEQQYWARFEKLMSKYRSDDEG